MKFHIVFFKNKQFLSIFNYVIGPLQSKQEKKAATKCIYDPMLLIWSLVTVGYTGMSPCIQPNSHGPLVAVLMELYCKIDLKNLMSACKESSVR